MDSLSDLIIRIKNAGNAGHDKVDLPSSKLKESLVKILVNTGLVRSYKIAKDSKQGIMRIYLKYDNYGKHIITSFEKISKPSRRVYISSNKIPAVRSGLGMCIVSTNKGMMSGAEAIKNNLGGELICKVW